MEEVSFNCHKCENCCSDPNGWVYLDNEDIKRLSLFFNLQPFEFTAKYVKYCKGNAVLSAPDFNPDCYFDKNQRVCKIYSARPRQCRTFPFWLNYCPTADSKQQLYLSCQGYRELCLKGKQDTAFNEPQTAIDIDYDTSHYFSEALHDSPSQQSHRHGLRLFYPHILLWIAYVQL